MNRINQVFDRARNAGHGALCAYITVGALPGGVDGTVAFATEIADAGADLIKLGVPFSDPTADDEVIQQAGQQALRHGTRYADVLAVAKRLRAARPELAIILFGYGNNFFQRGRGLGEELEQAGVDGILVVDVPFEERGGLMKICREHAISLIPLVAPTTSKQRAAQIAADCDGFVYLVAGCEVAGACTLPEELSGMIEEVKSVTALPVAAGFGISTPEMVAAVNRHADGAVVGSALMKTAMQEGVPAAVRYFKKLAASK